MFVSIQSISAQTSIQASFQRDTTIIKDINRIQNNIFSITSNISQHIKIVFSTLDTDKISIISSQQIDTTIQSPHIAYFPIYYKILSSSNKEISSIQAKVYDSKNNILQQYSFTIHLKNISNWGAFISQQKYFIIPTVGTQEVIINLYNDGNINEKIKTTLLRFGNTKKGVWEDSLVLPAKQNTQWHLRIPVKSIIKKKQKTVDFTIVISNKNGQVFNLPITALIPSNKYVKPNLYNKEGISVQTEVNQIWRDRTKQTTLGINGKIWLDSGAYINLQFKQYSFLPYQRQYYPSTLASIMYENKNTYIYTGNIIEVNDFFIDGWGIRFRKNFDSSSMAFTITKDRKQDAYFTNWQWKKNITHRLSFAQQLSTYNNIDIGNQSIIPQLQLRWADSNKTNIQLFLGGSRERIAKFKIDTTFFSAMQGYSFSKKWKSFTIQSSLLHHGKNYAGTNKGLDQHNHSITFEQKPFTIQTFYNSNTNNILYANDSALYLLQNIASSETGISVAWAHKQVFWQLKPSIFTQSMKDTAGLRSSIYQLNFNNRWYRGSIYFSLSGNIGVNQVTQQYTKYIYTHLLTASIQNSNTGLSISWDKGPYFYYDIKQFADYPTQLNRVYGLLYRDWDFIRKNVTMRSSIALQSDKFLGTTNFRFAHQVQYSIPKLDASIGLLAEWNTYFKYSNSIQINLRKNWNAGNIKSLFNRKRYVTLYKDENGNGNLDDKEMLFAHKPVWVNEQLLITNAKGQIAIKPSDIPSYKINLDEVEKASEWTPSNGYEQQIKANQNTNIAFQANGEIEGSVSITKAKFKIGSTQLDAIKIYIQNEFNRFAVTTDINGKFSLSIPNGTYNVIVDKNSLSENLDPIVATQQLIVIPQKTVDINIALREKERAIKIKNQ